MSKETRLCPTCGEAVDAGEIFCPSCGERLEPESAPQPVPVNDSINRNVTTGGGRTNVMGDNVVNAQDQSTTTNIDNSQTSNTNTVNNVQNTSSSVTNQQTVGSIDNSQQVVNNITIIGGAAGMTLPGGITLPGGQPQQKAVAPQSDDRSYDERPPLRRHGAPAAKGAPAFEVGEDENGDPVIRQPRSSGTKSYGSSASEPKGGGSGMGKWLAIIGVAAVAVVVWFMSKGSNDNAPAPAEETPAAVEQSAPAPAAKKKAAVKQEAPVEQAAPRTDANYEAGMKAYNAGDGLEAVRKFQASGSAEANYMLGVVYETGCGSVAPNAMKARSFFKKAAAQGSAEAKAKL